MRYNARWHRAREYSEVACRCGSFRRRVGYIITFEARESLSFLCCGVFAALGAVWGGGKNKIYTRYTHTANARLVNFNVIVLSSEGEIGAFCQDYKVDGVRKLLYRAYAGIYRPEILEMKS